MLAESWSDPSVVVSIAALLATVAVGVVAAVVARRASFAKRRLTHDLAPPARLLPPGSGDRLVVTCDGSALRDPHIAEVHLANTGRRDIASGLFDGARPIRFELNAPVVEILDTHWEGATHARPTVTADGSALLLQPTLLPRGLEMTVRALVDGRPSLTIHAELLDVDVRRRPRAATWEKSTRRAVLASAVALLSTVVQAVLLALQP
ncbi:hypothetical protein [Streptomyces clavuligerus]|uniref:Uncharacterized protein n=1 Tax=Streptomyces clavuligerus TaxID=1901 RepID=D5SL98_STRCL|nr:hypothetical protein [Streptomyces clavuligerus]EFG04691.1 Hypothetical protein SCLAV_p1205 [Streptomyces clavuligerus]WDN57250.1 hypothetical protein LL058_36345 [Streptomyces clavuligerus]